MNHIKETTKVRSRIINKSVYNNNLKFTHLQRSPESHTKVEINGTFVCWISNDDIECFVKAFRDLIRFYRIDKIL